MTRTITISEGEIVGELREAIRLTLAAERIGLCRAHVETMRKMHGLVTLTEHDPITGDAYQLALDNLARNIAMRLMWRQP